MLNFIAGMANGTTDAVDPWAAFWPSFLGGTAGSAVTAIVTVGLYFLTAFSSRKKNREEALKDFLDLVTQLGDDSLAGKQDLALFFKTNDALARLLRTSLAPRKPMYHWALNRIMAIFWFDTPVVISAARTGFTAHLFAWARNPWSLKERKHFLERAIPHAQGIPRAPVTWVDGTEYVPK